MNDIDTLLNAARQLSPVDQIRLLGTLHDELPLEHWPALSDAWQAEIARRSAAVTDGSMTIQDWTSIQAEVRREVGLDG